MRFEIPKFTRCCGCLPLRRGIIALGYLSLGFAVFFITVDLWFEGPTTNGTSTIYRGAIFVADKWLPILLYCIEIVFIVVLLVGAHTRRRRLLRIYYYYGITTCAAALVLYVIELLRRNLMHWGFYLIDACVMFAGIVTQVYLLLLIRSELDRPRDSLRTVNQLIEVFAQTRHGTPL